MNNERLQALLKHALEANDEATLRLIKKFIENPVYTWTARNDRPSVFDQQYSFVHDQFKGIAVALGGNGSGKSDAAAIKVAKTLLECPPPRKNTPFWVISRTYDIACGVCWAEKLSRFIDPDLIQHVNYYSHAKNWASTVVLKNHPNGNNWVVEFKSAETQRSNLQGASIGGFWADEQIPYEILMELYARCRDYMIPGAMMYTLTPLEPDMALEDIYNSPPEKFPYFKFYRLNSACNDRLMEGFVDSLLVAELEEKRETRLTGAFANLTGAVYKSFDPKIHVIDGFDIPPDWYHMRGIDFGYKDPTVCLWIAKDHKGCLFVYDEYYAVQQTIEEHVDAIMRVPWPEDLYHGYTWSDYGAAQERYEFSVRGLPTMCAKKDVKAGVATVQRALKPREDGHPRLFIFKKCEHLIKEMKGYRWHAFLDRPIKEFDHAPDALRYAVYSDAISMKDWHPLNLPEKQTSLGVQGTFSSGYTPHVAA